MSQPQESPEMEQQNFEPEGEEVQTEQQEKPPLQVLIGRSYTDKEYPDGTLIRSIVISFKRCTKVESELVQLAERVFQIAFDELHGLYDDLDLDLNGIYRYDLKSSALTANEYFPFNEKDFRRSGPPTLMSRIMTRIQSQRVFNIFRSSLMLQLMYSPAKP